MNEQPMTRLRAPSAATVREQVRYYIELWLGAMFLKQEAYTYERDQKNPFGNGLIYIAIIGVLVALAGIVGTGLRYATLPSVDAIKNTVLVHLQAMPFYESLSANGLAMFEQQFNQNWNQFGSRYLGYPTDTNGFIGLMLTVLTIPLGYFIGWLIYGALVHVVARGWNPETSFAELLAPLALATSPQLLSVLMLFPNSGLSGVAISLWTLICNIVAIRVAYQTTTRRAVWAALFPILLLVVLLAVLVCAGLALLIPLSRTVGGAQ